MSREEQGVKSLYYTFRRSVYGSQFLSRGVSRKAVGVRRKSQGVNRKAIFTAASCTHGLPHSRAPALTHPRSLALTALGDYGVRSPHLTLQNPVCSSQFPVFFVRRKAVGERRKVKRVYRSRFTVFFRKAIVKFALPRSRSLALTALIPLSRLFSLTPAALKPPSSLRKQKRITGSE